MTQRLPAWLVAFSLFVFSPVFASETETEVLTRLVHELQALSPIIEQARAVANPDNRQQFSYGLLQQDLTTIRHGIEEYLLVPRNQPRRISPLTGSYRQ